MYFYSNSSKHFKFEELRDNSLAVWFYPSPKHNDKFYFVVFRPNTRYHDLAIKISNGNGSWIENSWFALFCTEYDNRVISLI